MSLAGRVGTYFLQNADSLFDIDLSVTCELDQGVGDLLSPYLQVLLEILGGYQGILDSLLGSSSDLLPVCQHEQPCLLLTDWPGNRAERQWQHPQSWRRRYLRIFGFASQCHLLHSWRLQLGSFRESQR